VTQRVRTSDPASDEFTEAVRWYEARRSGLGAEFFDAVAATVSHIEANPEIGTTISTDGRTRHDLGWPESVYDLVRKSGHPRRLVGEHFLQDVEHFCGRAWRGASS
jgi:hypothetical protein